MYSGLKVLPCLADNRKISMYTYHNVWVRFDELISIELFYFYSPLFEQEL